MTTARVAARSLSVLVILITALVGSARAENRVFLSTSLESSQASYIVEFTATKSGVIDRLRLTFPPGPSDVSHGAQKYRLPVELENSANVDVSKMVRAAQAEDTLARKATLDAEEAARLAVGTEQRAATVASGEAKRKQHQDNALKHLLDAERHATGDEKLALQLELAQRFRDAGNYELAAKYYTVVADTTDQESLRHEASRLAHRYSQQQPKKGPEQPR